MADRSAFGGESPVIHKKFTYLSRLKQGDKSDFYLKNRRKFNPKELPEPSNHQNRSNLVNMKRKTPTMKPLFGILTFAIIILIVAPYACKSQEPFAASHELSNDLHWRFVGPYRAGWATMAVGIPSEPEVFYFGGAGGGVWKTTDAGRTWQGLMQHEESSSIGAIDIAPSNPDFIYAGTGQVAFRWDIPSGDGVYRSSDGGKTWQNIGLRETLHIGRILVDPDDPQKVLVAALGNIFAPNSDRGVYLTIDGGRAWQKTLFVNDSTGAIDLASDQLHPSIVYAALWQMQMHPWLDYFMPQTGTGSGIFKSIDGGLHWEELSGSGLPDGPLGRIGLGVARGSGGSIVYATIIASKSQSGLYRSNDGGKTWDFVNHDADLANNYFSRVTVDPNNPDIVYVMDRSIHRSADGGKTFEMFKGAPGGDDYHFLWINPSNTAYMITASDQGCVVSVDSGKTWSSWYNQPTGQFYHVAVDDQFPYKIYSGQQDNGTVGILSRGPYGVIEDRDWHPVGGDERDYDVPKPGNPNLVFGSGLGGHVSRFDETTRQVAEISPWPVSSYGQKLTDVKYRYTWLTPLVFSAIGKHALYLGNQFLFKSTDDGDGWERISPDLTGKVEGVKDNDNPDLLQARDAGYGVIYSIAPSPIAEGVIWVGTDDGIIQLTTDGGRHWKNVTPPTIPLWAQVASIDATPFSAREAYVAVNTERLGYSKPIILKTTDDGKTWATIAAGLPADEHVYVVRTDNVKKGILFAGTNRTVYVSFNDGENWQPLTLNAGPDDSNTGFPTTTVRDMVDKESNQYMTRFGLPTTTVRDMVVHDNDLVVCTQGRGIWTLDDIEPLRELTPDSRHEQWGMTLLKSEDVHLFRPADAVRVRADENKDTPWPPETPLGQNPPTGAIIDYWLKTDSKNPVVLMIRDSKGSVVRTFSSDERPEELPTEFRYFQKGWTEPEKELEATAGMHRFVWDLKYPRPPALEYDFDIAAVWPVDEDNGGTPLDPDGPLALPGKYTATLSANGKEYTQDFMVKLDPRVHPGTPALREQLSLAMSIDAALKEDVSAYNAAKKILEEKQITGSAADSISAIADKESPSLSSVAGVMAGLATAVQGADAAPTQGEKDVYRDYTQKLNELLARLKRIENSFDK